MRRKISFALALILGVQSFAGFPAAAAVKTAGQPETAVQAENKTAGQDAQPYIVDDIDAYENLEILTETKDGEVSVYSCGSREELEQKLGELSSMAGISVIQPNYQYENQALSVNDASAAEQWALDNDGSFRMDEQEVYPIYGEEIADWHYWDRWDRAFAYAQLFADGRCGNRWRERYRSRQSARVPG